MTDSGSTLVGLTGGIGSGKSRVAALLRELGAAVECSDLIVRELQAPGGAALIEIIRNSLLLLGVDPYWQGTFVGAFIVLAIALERLRRRTT